MAVISTAVLLKALPYIAAGVGLDFLLKGYTKVKGVGLQEKQMELLLKQLQQKAGIGREESARYDKLVKQLLGVRQEETRRTQETELVRSLETGRTRQTALVMAMMQSLMGQGPTGFTARGGPPASMVSLLR